MQYRCEMDARSYFPQPLRVTRNFGYISLPQIFNANTDTTNREGRNDPLLKLRRRKEKPDALKVEARVASTKSESHLRPGFSSSHDDSLDSAAVP
jgi:hypothetical protein